MRKWIHKAATALVVAGLFSSAAGPAAVSLPGYSGVSPTRLISAAGAEVLTASLSEDPVVAAVELAEVIYRGSLPEAQAAAVELLRRSGVPVVSPDGPVIALPDRLVLADAALYEGQVLRITVSVRSGAYYSPDQLSQLLAGLFETDPIPADVLVGALGQWGKQAGDPQETRSAGAAVRALGAQRGQVLFPEADLEELELDLLQVALVLSHMTSDTWLRRTGAGSLQWIGVGTARAQGPCDGLYGFLNPDNEYLKNTDDMMRDRLVDLIKNLAQKLGKDLGKTLDALTESLDVASIFYLLLAAEIKVLMLNPRPHFHHKENEHGGAHTTAEAKATFESGMEPGEVKCYALAGINVPPPGPMEGFRVRWRIRQPINQYGEGKYLKVMANHGRKLDACGTCGDVLDGSGVSRLPMYTPVEPEPDRGLKLEGQVRITAALDKDDFPLKAADFIFKEPGDLAKWPRKKLIDLVKSAVSKAGLPNAVVSVPVEYHGAAVYRMKGSRNLWGFYYSLPISVDMVSCSGLEGPWMGETAIGIESGRVEAMFRSLASQAFGVGFPAPGKRFVEPREFSVNPAVRNSVPVLPDQGITGEIEIYPPYRANQKQYTGVVGKMEVLLSGYSFGDFKETGSTPFVVLIEGVQSDPRCPTQDARYGNE